MECKNELQIIIIKKKMLAPLILDYLFLGNATFGKYLYINKKWELHGSK